MSAPAVSSTTTSSIATKPKMQDLEVNTNGQIFGTSKYLLPNPAGFVAEAEFAPSCRCLPCGICPSCPDCFDCMSDLVFKRTYARLYENRIEINYAWTRVGICCCCMCSTDNCVQDNVAVYYFDQEPSTKKSMPFPFCILPSAGACRPVMAVYSPKCCCCKCCAQTIFAGPCAIPCFFGLCGDSCMPCSYPLLTDIKNGEKFLSAYKAAYDSYASKRSIKKTKRSKFLATRDGCCGFRVEEIPDNIWDMTQANNLVEMQVMDRGGPERSSSVYAANATLVETPVAPTKLRESRKKAQAAATTTVKEDDSA